MGWGIGRIPDIAWFFFKIVSLIGNSEFRVGEDIGLGVEEDVQLGVAEDVGLGEGLYLWD